MNLENANHGRDESKFRLFFPYVLSFLIPIITLLFAYKLIDIYPFGEKSLLTRDMNGQYVSYFSYYKEKP